MTRLHVLLAAVSTAAVAVPATAEAQNYYMREKIAPSQQPVTPVAAAWQTGEWSSWSSECSGSSTRTRTAVCARGAATVADSECAGARPASSEVSPVYTGCTYTASYGAWTTPAACGAVTETRTATCTRSDGQTVDPATHCGVTASDTSRQGASSATCTTSVCGSWTQSKAVTAIHTDVFGGSSYLVKFVEGATVAERQQKAKDACEAMARPAPGYRIAYCQAFEEGGGRTSVFATWGTNAPNGVTLSSAPYPGSAVASCSLR